MDYIKTESICSIDTRSSDLNEFQFFGCVFHGTSYILFPDGTVTSTVQKLEMKLPCAIVQVVVTCCKEPDTCHFYFRGVNKKVYKWTWFKREHQLGKRIKLDEKEGEYKKIASKVDFIMAAKKPGIVLFTKNSIECLYTEQNTVEQMLHLNPGDNDITCYQYLDNIDSCFYNFFPLDSLLKNAFIYGTKKGCVFWRQYEENQVENIKLIAFEDNEEEVKYIALLCVPLLSKDLNTLIVVGNRGTIMVYSRASNKKMAFKQFNLQGPIYSFEKAHKDLTFLMCSENGKLSMLEFTCNNEEIELQSTRVLCHHHPVLQVRICNTAEYTFDLLSDQKGGNVQIARYKYDPTPVSIENHPNAISDLIQKGLQELKAREQALKSLDRAEKELNQKLVSTNKTLYALQSINNKRKSGFFNSLESTGFEFTMHSVIKSESIANCSLHSTAYLRMCIKTSRFLELEEWDIELSLFPQASLDQLGEIKMIPVAGFESCYQNGIESYSMWERDVDIDLEKVKLPIQVAATLIMTIDQNNPPLRFPISTMWIDDLHYAVPCPPDFILTIERRGLQEVSQRLIDSHHKQKLFDKSGRYPFARLLRSKSSDKRATSKSLFKYTNLHIRCLVDLHITDESYRSILASVLSEGRTMDDMKRILQGAEIALFTLAAFPACPIIIKLSRVSSTMIDFSIQCIYPPALFKAEAALLSRLFKNFIQIPAGEGLPNATFLKKMKLLQESVLNAQEKYQEQEMDLDDEEDKDEPNSFMYELKKSTDLLLGIHNDEPIGHFVI